MNKVILTPNSPVNTRKLLKSGFFAVISSLCGLLAGSVGCSVPTKIYQTGRDMGASLVDGGASLVDRIQSLVPNKSTPTEAIFIPEQAALTPAPDTSKNRAIHPQFLARLDANRKPLDGNSTNSPEWDVALYHAIKPSSQDFSYLPPHVREISGEPFGAMNYRVDSDAGTTEILAEAFETQPYTGQAIIEDEDGTQRLVAFIDNGRLTGVGTLWNENGTQMLAQNHYDELGFVARAMVWNADGTLMAQSPPADGKRPMPKGAILVAQAEVRGEFIYRRADDVRMAKLTEQIEAATEQAERTQLQGELLNLQLAAGTPFSGTVMEFWDEDRSQKKREEPVQVGKHNGTVTWWYENGKKQFEAEYLKGVPQGRTAWSREDGSLEYEGFWENDKLLRATTWDAADQKTGEVTAGNGTLVYFHSNGQKRLEEAFANGDLDATKWWDEEGKEVESAPPSYIPAPPKLD